MRFEPDTEGNLGTDGMKDKGSAVHSRFSLLRIGGRRSLRCQIFPKEPLFSRAVSCDSVLFCSVPRYKNARSVEPGRCRQRVLELVVSAIGETGSRKEKESKDTMRSSAEAVAVARDVASSSPSKNTSALDMNVMRYQRISPDCLPLANGSSGSGSTASRKPPAQEPRSSTDVHDAATADTSRLASFLAAASLEPHKPRARGLLPTPVSSSAAAVVIRSPARDHGHQPSGFADYATQNPNPTGGSSSAAPDGSVRLQWGHNKRSRGRRDSPAPPPSPAQARRRASIKIQLQRRNAAASASAPAPAEKLMPPPSGRGGPIIRATSSLPPRSAAVAAADALHGRVTVGLSHHRSAEEPRAAGAEPHPSPAKQQHSRPHRQASEKEKGKAPAIPEPPLPRQQQPAARPEVPRIFTTLSRREKEEDFLAMKGAKLPQRPKKRPKAVEKAVSTIYPGQWLSDVSRSRYMVREKKSKKQKRGGGLKAMDSDSD